MKEQNPEILKAALIAFLTALFIGSRSRDFEVVSCSVDRKFPRGSYDRLPTLLGCHPIVSAFHSSNEYFFIRGAHDVC